MKKYYFEDHVLTGIQFVRYTSTFSLRLFGKKIDIFELGIMNAKEYTKSKISKIEGNEISMKDRKPGLSNGAMQYPGYKLADKSSVTFETSSYSKALMLPFFDGVPVTFDIMSPIAGIGFHHYTNDDAYAGYIRPYLIDAN